MERSLQLHVTVVLVLFSTGVYSQANTKHQSLLWYAYYQTISFNPSWYVQAEVQERHFINPAAQHQFLVRAHVHRVLGNSGWETSAGGCFFLNSPNDPGSLNRLTVPELRPHVEFAYKQKLQLVTLDHRYRAEARFFHNTNTAKTALENGYGFGNFRFRYRLQATAALIRIGEERALKLRVYDEIHLNARSKAVKYVFDQNRIYAGLSIDALPSLTFDAGYLNFFQQASTGGFYNRHILNLTINHRINLQ